MNLGVNKEESLGNRTQVAKKVSYKRLKDKLLLIGTILLCIAIGIGGVYPKHKNKQELLDEEKQSATFALNQNLEMIAALRDKTKSQGGYKGGDPMHPPKLRTGQSNMLTKETLARMNAPSTFFTVNGETKSSVGAVYSQSKTLISRDANAEFLNQQNDITAVSAKALPHPTLTVPAGEMIPATLETAIDSELAGMVRAVTSRDVFALSGNKLLIPKGSTVIGQFNTAVTQGQSRIFVVWNRVRMSNGITVALNSPSSDQIGRSGLGADYINRHFFERFATSTLYSVLGGYSSMGGVHAKDEYNSMSQYRMNIAGSFQQAANQSLQQDLQIPTNLQKFQGASINIFVAHDLDFYRVSRRV